MPSGARSPRQSATADLLAGRWNGEQLTQTGYRKVTDPETGEVKTVKEQAPKGHRPLGLWKLPAGSVPVAIAVAASVAVVRQGAKLPSGHQSPFPNHHPYRALSPSIAVGGRSR